MVSIRARAMRALIRAGTKSLPTLTIQERRARIEHITRRSNPPRGTTVQPLEAGNVRGEWVSGPDPRADRIVLYLHGGAFCVGSPASHRNLVARIARAASARALSLDYRLAPEHPFPAALEDTLAAYRYLLRQGVEARRIVIAGDSAGANLALAAIVALRDAGTCLPAAAVCISPPTDLGGTSESLVTRASLDPLLKLESIVPLARAYVENARVEDPLISPLRADLRGLPPLLIQVGSHEILYDDSVRLASKAREAGVDVTLEVGEKMWHVWHATVPYVPEAKTAIRSIGRFIIQHTPDPETGAEAGSSAAAD